MRMTRRVFCGAAFAGLAGCARGARRVGTAEKPPFPLVDLHVHLDNSTVDQVLALSAERGVKFGIVEHAGSKENEYPVVLSNDEELLRYLATLEGKPVYKGVQAEGMGWRIGFSRGALLKLDYILTDAMTLPGPNGKPMKLWEKPEGLGTAQEFMARYVDRHLLLIANMSMDILANGSWLPEAFAADYDTLWTEARVAKVVEALARNKVALEISSGFSLPKLPWLRQAKAAGVKFTMGSNGRYPKMGLLEYSLEMAEQLELTADDFFLPDGKGPHRLPARRPQPPPLYGKAAPVQHHS